MGDQRSRNTDRLTIGERLPDDLERGLVLRDPSDGDDHPTVHEVEVQVRDHDLPDAADFDPGVHRPVQDFDRPSASVPDPREHGSVLRESRGVGIVVPGRDRHHHRARTDELREPVDVTVGVAILDEPMREPDDRVDAEERAESLFDLLAAHRRIPVGVQETLLRGQQRSLPIHEERAAFQHEGCLVATHAEMRREYFRHTRVVVVREELLAPGVEPELDETHVPGLVGDEDRAVVPHPGVVDRGLQGLHTGAASPAHVRRLPGVADHRDRLEHGDRTSDAGPLVLRGIQQGSPPFVAGGPGHQGPLMQCELGRDREPVVARRRHFLHRAEPSLRVCSPPTKGGRCSSS
jgi:hypothetical protein